MAPSPAISPSPALAPRPAPALVVEGVGKRFAHRDPARPRTFRDFAQGGWRHAGPRGTFWALRGVSFSVEPGEMLGVVGSNGSGKSTLLRMLGGVMRPDEGRIRAAAEVSGLLDLNAGMHPDLTGRENAIGVGILSGLSRAEITARMDDVIDFAEIEGFIDEPVRTYSAGMRLRLGFAVAAQTRPRILLVDEVLAVGDIGFQRKCLDRIAEFRAGGCAIVLISHDLAQVEATCDRVLWLRDGAVAGLGAARGVVSLFQSEMLQATAERTPEAAPGEEDVPAQVGAAHLRLNHNRFGSLESRITRVQLLDASGREVSRVGTGEPLSILLWVDGRIRLDTTHVSVTLANDKGVDILDATTEAGGLALPARAGAVALRLDLGRLDLAQGRYLLSVGLYEAAWTFAYDRHVNAYDLWVDGPDSWCALVPPQSWQLQAEGGEP